jgi:hypothetical protein
VLELHEPIPLERIQPREDFPRCTLPRINWTDTLWHQRLKSGTRGDAARRRSQHHVIVRMRAKRIHSHLRSGCACSRDARAQPDAGTIHEHADCTRHSIAGSGGIGMYHHVKKLMYTVRVDTPDPKFGNMLLEQFGGANGELAAAMQYSIQGLNCEDPERKDLLMDIGTEELSHLEIVGACARCTQAD